MLEEVVLAHVQMVTSYILRFEDYFRQVMTAQKRQASKEAIQIRKKELDRDERRISELKRLFINTILRLKDYQIWDVFFALAKLTGMKQRQGGKDAQ